MRRFQTFPPSTRTERFDPKQTFAAQFSSAADLDDQKGVTTIRSSVSRKKMASANRRIGCKQDAKVQVIP
jgi:hypothetical protein